MRTFRAAWWGVWCFAAVIALGGGSRARAADGRAGDPADSAAADSAIVDISVIRERAEQMPIDRRLDMDKRIRATIDKVNDDAARRGQAVFAAKLAAAYGTTKDALLDEKATLGLGWGDLVVAHTLLGNSARKVALVDLATLRSDGLSWSAIAYGLQFHMEDLEDVIKSGGKIASGL